MPVLSPARSSPLLAIDPLAPMLLFVVPIALGAAGMRQSIALGPVAMGFAVASLPFLGAVVAVCAAFLLATICSYALARRAPDAAGASYAVSLPLAALTLVGVAELTDVPSLIAEAHTLEPSALAALILVGIMAVATSALSARTAEVVRGARAGDDFAGTGDSARRQA